MKIVNHKKYVFLSMILSSFLISSQGHCTSSTATPEPSAIAINACSDKEKGDACEFTNDKGDSVNGRCGYANDQSKLFCVAYQ